MAHGSPFGWSGRIRTRLSHFSCTCGCHHSPSLSRFLMGNGKRSSMRTGCAHARPSTTRSWSRLVAKPHAAQIPTPSSSSLAEIQSSESSVRTPPSLIDPTAPAHASDQEEDSLLSLSRHSISINTLQSHHPFFLFHDTTPPYTYSGAVYPSGPFASAHRK